MFFNDIERAYIAGTRDNVAVDTIKHITSLKTPLIEQIQRHDWVNALEIIKLMFEK